jgi:hypothetical protein
MGARPALQGVCAEVRAKGWACGVATQSGAPAVRLPSAPTLPLPHEAVPSRMRRCSPAPTPKVLPRPPSPRLGHLARPRLKCRALSTPIFYPIPPRAVHACRHLVRQSLECRNPPHLRHSTNHRPMLYKRAGTWYASAFSAAMSPISLASMAGRCTLTATSPPPYRGESTARCT